MRFLHTSDWHLGRLLHGVHLTEDQGYVLEQLIDLTRDSRPDVVIVAGDIYDRAVPLPGWYWGSASGSSSLPAIMTVPIVLISVRA
jgi:exonuclease SbcD